MEAAKNAVPRRILRARIDHAFGAFPLEVPAERALRKFPRRRPEEADRAHAGCDEGVLSLSVALGEVARDENDDTVALALADALRAAAADAPIEHTPRDDTSPGEYGRRFPSCVGAVARALYVSSSPLAASRPYLSCPSRGTLFLGTRSARSWLSGTSSTSGR